MIKKSEKHIMKKDVLKKNCFSHIRKNSLVLVFTVSFAGVLTLVAMFGRYAAVKVLDVSSERISADGKFYLVADQLAKRHKRQTNENFHQNKNMIKRNTDNDDIEDFLVTKYKNINRNSEIEEFSDEIEAFLQKRSSDFKNSIRKLEMSVVKNIGLLESLAMKTGSEETANLIEKDLEDVESEIRSMDDNIVPILETALMIDNTVHKRLRHKRDTKFMAVDPKALKLYMPMLEEKKREKRLVQEKLAEVRDKFIRCKKSANENSSSCDGIYHSVIDKFREISKMFKDIELIIDEMENFDRARSSENESDTRKKDKDKKKKKKKDKKSSEESRESSSEEHTQKTSSTVKPITVDSVSEESTVVTTSDFDETTTLETTTFEFTDLPFQVDSFRLKSRGPMGSFSEIIVQSDFSTGDSMGDEKTTTVSSNAKEKLETSESCPASSFLGHPKFEEDLDDTHHLFEHNTLDEVVSNKIQRQQRGPFSESISNLMEDARTLVEETEELIEEVFDPNLGDPKISDVQTIQKTSSTIKTSDIGASGPFIALCEQVAKGKQAQQIQTQPLVFETHNNAPIQVPVSGFANSAFHFSATPTEEIMKGSSQFSSTNPGFISSSYPYPVCFVNYPQYRTTQQYFYPGLMPMYQPGIILTDTIDEEFIRENNRNAYIPSAGGFHPIQLNQAHVQELGGYRAANEESQQAYCTFLANESKNLPAHYSETVEQPSVTVNNFKTKENNDQDRLVKDKNEERNIPSQFDIIYATYPNNIFALNHSGQHNHCDPGKVPCLNSNQCIVKKQWCDSKVDCLDASDETACSCKARLSESRICDGYVDCPMGSDELGCFGCAKFQYSCYNSLEEFEKGGHSPSLMCYSSVDKCDGFNNCRNGKDELECSMIVKNVGAMQSYTVSHSEGILHHNFKGRWYPVCKDANLWATEACERENGKLSIQPSVTVKAASLPGPYIQPHFNQHNHLIVTDPFFSESCHPGRQLEGGNHVIYVKCPPMKCGVSKLFENENLKARENFNSSRRIRRNEEERIVGGNDALPMEFPFIVVIYKDGHFHCGGSIFDENWIITAAHCTRSFTHHFYEVRAGILRRSSYSPSAQISKVIQVISHPDYDRTTMKNDIALMKVQTQFSFNRYVRPICMPFKGRSTLDGEWKFGPVAGTICTTLGWGAIREKGSDSDELKVVDVPIMQKCKYAYDQESKSICAGETFGTRDACQGDSGGPLVCKSVSNPVEWYLAGVVSHGEGCARANEPGVYTRVALYLDWIRENTDRDVESSFVPHLNCPGYTCVWGGGKCIASFEKCDGIVDCLGGEDEAECTTSWLDLLLESNGSSSQIDLVQKPQSDKKINKTLEVKTDINANPFHCKKISQVVNFSQRCDKVFDCEDGTDEDNCTCSDYLKSSFSKLICDGHVDCSDLSDEAGCMNCNTTEFTCPHSKKCIDKTLYCNGIPDCLFKEDELDCIALTDGFFVNLDVNGKAFNLNKGIVTQNIQSEWKILCDDDGSFDKPEVANEICQVIGFSSANSSRVVKFSSINRDPPSSSTENDPRMKILRNSESIIKNECNALEVVCVEFQSHSSAIFPIQHEKLKKNATVSSHEHNDISELFFVPINSTDQTHLVVTPSKKINSPDEPTVTPFQYLSWPWISNIFVNGEFISIGMLVHKSWVLVDKSIFKSNEPLHESYVVALFGNSRSQLKIESPYEQLKKIDCLHYVNNSNAMLLHLQTPVDFNRYVVPGFIPSNQRANDSGNDTSCLALAPDLTITKSLTLETNHNCTHETGQICYQIANKLKITAKCEIDNLYRTSMIVCKKANSGWYAKAFHQLNKGLCDFFEPIVVSQLLQNEDFEKIRKITEHPCGKCEHHAISIKCDTHRCPLGKCLETHQLCDNSIECHDRSDEQEEICLHVKKGDRPCGKDEFHCRNGKCIKKSMFCNHVNDCGDKSDEPSECTCFSYLKATAPKKICDGTRHCWDKSDEDPIYCGTNCSNDSTSFKCGRSPFCVPLEMVCDKRADCPNGADEQYCHGVHGTSDGYGEVMQRSFGIWHSKCFPKHSPPTQEELEDLCKKLGHNETSNVQGRVKFLNTNIDLVEFKSIDATKVVPYTKFSAVKINDEFTVHLRPSKPLAKLVYWDDHDHENCHRIEIKCSS